MRVCKKCGYPLNNIYFNRYCDSCRNVMGILSGGDYRISKTIENIESDLLLKLPRKDKNKLIHYLTMKKAQKIANGNFFSKPRQPILTSWLFK